MAKTTASSVVSSTALLITEQSQIAEAPTATLVATYNHLEGKSIKAFENRAVAERRVAMAILAAKDRAGHKGTQPNAAPKTLDGAETASKEVKAPKVAEAVKAAKVPKVAKEPKAPKAPKEPKAPRFGIGAFCVKHIALGKTNDEILALVQQEQPTARTSLSCIAWYRGQAKKNAAGAAAK